MNLSWPTSECADARDQLELAHNQVCAPMHKISSKFITVTSIRNFSVKIGNIMRPCSIQISNNSLDKSDIHSINKIKKNRHGMTRINSSEIISQRKLTVEKKKNGNDIVGTSSILYMHVIVIMCRTYNSLMYCNYAQFCVNFHLNILQYVNLIIKCLTI